VGLAQGSLGSVDGGSIVGADGGGDLFGEVRDAEPVR
jgi:hypothetical protein